MSRSLREKDIPTTLVDRVELSRMDPEALMRDLESRGVDRVYVDGGAVVRAFLSSGLVRDMKLTVVPILLGTGLRLFGDLTRDINLRLRTSRSFPSGLVEMVYDLEEG